jgi:chromosomal replication initiation ATPase DnaA
MKINPYYDIIFLTGMMGTGKSYFTEKMFLTGVKRKVVYDRNWEHGDKGFIVHTVSEIRKAWLFDGLTSIIFQPYTFTDEEFDQLSKFIRTLDNLLFMVEEVEFHAHARGYTSQAFREIVNRGRHQGIGLIVTARRPHLIHKDIRGNITYMVVFQMQEEDDVKYVSRWIGVSEEAIKTLPEYHSFLYIRKGRKVVRQKPC